MKKYVWLNLNTGEFSNSWDEKMQELMTSLEKDIPSFLKESAKEGWKLIEYTCLNDENFDFYNKMKIVTNGKA